MAGDEKWYFTKEQLLQSPSRKSGYDVDKELSCRQQAANFIQDMGQRLQVFYVFHSLAAFHRNAIAAAALFLAAKVEEQPRKLEHVIKVAHMCLHRENPNLDTKSELYLEQAQDLVFNENVLLQTLGFDVAIDHPHTHVVRCCHLVRASKDLAQTSYFMASNSLHLTTMCLQYKPTVVACFCIHLACKWSNWEIPRSNEGKDWFWYIDKTVTVDLLEQLTAEFLAILDKCPTKLKRKMMSMNQNNTPGFTQQTMPNDTLHFEKPRKLTGAEANKPPEGLFPVQKSSSQSSSESKTGGTGSASSSSSSSQSGHTHHQKIDYREYREKKERERMEREKQQQQQQQQHQRDGHNMSSSNHHHHHSKSGVMPGKNHSAVQSRSSGASVSHKSYQQPPHGMQQSVHYPTKDARDPVSQGFQSSSSKDGTYLKQHPPHPDRDQTTKDGVPFRGQYPSNSAPNIQHSAYPHKPDPNYSGNYSHRDGTRGSHSVQSVSGNSNLPQAHISQSQNRSDKFEETDLGEESGNWSFGMNLSSVRNEKNSMPVHVKNEPGKNEFSVDSNSDSFISSKQQQSMHPLKMIDPKYKGHHFHSSSKSSDIPQIKLEKPSSQSSSDFSKKLSDRPTHEKHRKPQELERVPNPVSLSSSLTDPNFVKTSKTSSIFSPDSKIPPQNILNSLEKDSKKVQASGHRLHTDKSVDPNKKTAPPSSLPSIPSTTTSSTGSLFSPPLPKNAPSAPSRHRTSSSGSEPELIPVLTKLEETPGYENIMKERKIALTPTNASSPTGAEKEKKTTGDKPESAFLFDFGGKANAKESNKTNEAIPNDVKSEVPGKGVVKFSNEIRSDLGAVIYPTNPKSSGVSKGGGQGYGLGESKMSSLANCVSTVNLLGIEKMVDTSISPGKGLVGSSVKGGAVGSYGSSVGPGSLGSEGSDKGAAEHKSNAVVSSQESGEVDVLGYSEKKRSEKKKKKEKHKHKDKDKSERKKEKKKHKEKDKEKSKEKDKHKEKEKHKEKQREKEIDVVNSETPIKITIPKDKISGSLKIKISKDCLKKEEAEPPAKANTSGELKIKISKDVFSNMNTYKEEGKGESRKRERSPKSSGETPHSKAARASEKQKSVPGFKSNGMEGSSRNSNSHKYSVSETDSCFDISSLYDCPFDFEENGEGIIKTPDYDFEALHASDYPQEGNTSPDAKQDCDKNSHNESGIEPGAEGSTLLKDFDPLPASISPVKDVGSPGDPASATSAQPSPILYTHSDIRTDGIVQCDDSKKDKMISLENCDVLKNYKTILDSHSRRCEPEILRQSVSPVSPEETPDNNNDDNNNKPPTDSAPAKPPKTATPDSDNPNYYNKYFKKDNSGSRLRSRDDKWTPKDKNRFDDRQRYYDARRYRSDYADRRDDRRFYREYRDYTKEPSQYYYKDDRRFDYPEYATGQYFTPTKPPEGSLTALNYDMSANSAPTVYQNCSQSKPAAQFQQICDSALPGSSSDMNVSYQYGYFNNYMYPPNGGYRFYGNVPFVNVSLIQQQPIPPGTGDALGPAEPPPLPLEPPPDLPPPPETPPPPK